MVDANTPSLDADETAVVVPEPTLASLVADPASLGAFEASSVPEPLDANVQHTLADQQVATAVLPLPTDAGPDPSDSELQPEGPPATVLLPYFEIDLDDPSSPSSLFDVNTASDPNPSPALEQPVEQHAGPDPSDSELQPEGPPATVLLPYFEIDLDDPSSPSSLFDVNAATGAEADLNPQPLPPGPPDALDADQGTGVDEVQQVENYQSPGFDDGSWDTGDGAPLEPEAEMASDAGGFDAGADYTMDDGLDGF